jgi:two-component system LytT family response regulator
MTPFKAIIIDDERLARSELRSLLLRFDFIETCGEAANAIQALKLVKEHRPQLLFLDIEMPGRNGFDFLASLPPPLPHVVFTTAFDAFAIRAFEVNALDYLMKPIDPKRLEVALDKVRLRAGQAEAGPTALEAASAESEAALTEDDHVFVREGDRCWFVPVRSILLLEAEGNHTRVHFDRERPLLYRTIVSMEARLPAKLFLRANRSQLVNLTFIDSIGQWFSGSLKVTLRGGVEVEFSRRQAQIFRERLSL